MSQVPQLFKLAVRHSPSASQYVLHGAIWQCGVLADQVPLEHSEVKAGRNVPDPHGRGPAGARVGTRVGTRVGARVAPHVL